MEPTVTISLVEYEKMKELAERKDIPATVDTADWVTTKDGVMRTELTIDIDMRELKLQICRQNDIDPEMAVINFY